MAVITVERKILEKNDLIAAENRKILQAHNITTFNLLSSPGSGKTTLLEKLLPMLDIPCAVIEGDLDTDRDARRIDALGVPAVQIVTHGGCHLEAILVRDALQNLDLTSIRLLFIENVGNLVCPASFDLGESFKVVVMSTTEGDDKPIKYSTMFRNAQVCVFNKTDLLPYVDFDIQAAKVYASQINPNLRFFSVSAKTMDGMDELAAWFRSPQ